MITKKKIFALIFIPLVVLLVLGLLAKNIIVKHSLIGGIKMVTGLDTHLDSVNVGITNTLIGINGLKIYNPDEYLDRIMLNMPEMYIDYDLMALTRNQIHLKEIRINLQELVVVKSKDNKLNISAVKPPAKPQKKQETPTEPQKEAKKADILIDKLHLKIGRVIYKDYSKGKPQALEFKVNIDEKLENITDPHSLIGMIVTKVLLKTPIAGMVGALGNQVTGMFKDAAKMTADATKKVATEAKESVQKAGDQLKEGIAGAKEQVEKQTEEIMKDSKESLKETSQQIQKGLEKVKKDFKGILGTQEPLF